ncbi:peptide-methionine (S)-S-oxide reductase MsrA [Flavobacterium sp.]|uniref:peptide-methionine (S)-S-oxide reductase MsrA n=1 Tax=Flavobacterium sp. TaxID=239 RepID=UPI003B9BBF8E
MRRLILLLLTVLTTSCHSQSNSKPQPIKKAHNMELATFAGGCFWCTEAVFLDLKGVKAVQSGYTGGKRPNPTYEQVSSGGTGHAEAIQIEFDPSEISYEELLEVFFATHDPTTLNRQGADVGTQYRSEVFYHSDAQKEAAENYIAQMTAALTFKDPIVTKVSAAQPWYPAEDYHQNYYKRNTSQSYCHYVITPKVEKVRKVFKDKLKS